MNKLFIRRGGILGALHLFITLLIIFQNDFWEVLGLFALLPRFIRLEDFEVSTACWHSVRKTSSLTLSSALFL